MAKIALKVDLGFTHQQILSSIVNLRGWLRNAPTKLVIYSFTTSNTFRPISIIGEYYMDYLEKLHFRTENTAFADVTLLTSVVI